MCRAANGWSTSPGRPAKRAVDELQRWLPLPTQLTSQIHAELERERDTEFAAEQSLKLVLECLAGHHEAELFTVLRPRDLRWRAGREDPSQSTLEDNRLRPRRCAKSPFLEGAGSRGNLWLLP